MSKERARGLLQDAAEQLKSQYERPPKRPGEPLVEDEYGRMTVYVSNVRPPSGAGNTMHQGNWVVIEYDERRKELSVIYKKDGIAGNSDKRSVYQVENTTGQELADQATDYMPR